MRHIVVPYDRAANQFLPREKETWNYFLSRQRMVIEHTLGILKARFCSLKSMAMQINHQDDEARAQIWIHCCAILHNISMDNATIDRFWADKGGLEGMIRMLDTLRGFNERDTRRYEDMTGATIDEPGYTLEDTALVQDDTLMELLRTAAEQREYRPYLDNDQPMYDVDSFQAVARLTLVLAKRRHLRSRIHLPRRYPG